MQHVIATNRRLGPAAVTFQIRYRKFQAVARLGAHSLQHETDFALTLRMAHCRAHMMTRPQQLQCAMAGDKARPTGYQDPVHGPG